jgi:response regulator RpfG family c-di-GMP phosphodiesterase
MAKARILVVEDEAITGLSIVEKLQAAGYKVVGSEAVFSAEEAISKAGKEKPDLILMDIVLQGEMDGIEAAAIIKDKYDIPVVYVTAYADVKLLERAKITTPFGYIVKPFSDRELFSNIEIAIYKHDAEKALKLSKERLQKTFVGTINAIAKMVEIKSPELADHQQRIASLSVAIARELQLTNEQVEGIKVASLVHTIGLIGIPNELIRHARAFSKEEEKIYKMYPKYGHEILEKIEFPWPVAKIVLQHRELIDGSGFPEGIKGNDMLFESKILSVALFVEAHIVGDLFIDKISVADTLQQLQQLSDKQFDAKVVTACLAVFKEKKFHLA